MTRAVVGAFAFGLVLSCAPATQPEPPPEPAAVDAAAGMWDIVGGAWRWHIESAKRKNLDAVLEIYADDIVYIAPGHVDVRGIESVREMEANTLATNEVVDAKHTTLSLQLFDDVAYEIGTVVGPIRVGDAPPAVVRYHFMAMWQRGADDGWRIRHIVGQAPPADAPEYPKTSRAFETFREQRTVEATSRVTVTRLDPGGFVPGRVQPSCLR